MLELREYTKNELGEFLGINVEKASNLTDKLTKLGYKFTRNGKGATYRIKIIELPKRGLKEFAKEHLNVECRDIDKLAHLLNLLLLDNTDLPLLETTASAISHYTYLSKEKIKECLVEFENSGLIKKDYTRVCAYATKHEIVKQEIDKDAEIIDLTNPHYTYYIIVRIITLEEYHKAYNAFYETYNTLTIGIEDNPDMIPEIAIQKANGAKKESIDGWWPCASLVVPYVINKEWPHLPELLDILRAYKFEDYHHSYSGNAQRDYEKQIAQEEEIKRKLQEKRDRLMSLQSENARLKALLAQMESKLNEKEKKEAKAPVNCVIPLLDDSKVKPYKNVDISSMDMAAIIQQENEIERKRKEEFWEMMKICDNEVPDKSFTLDELMIELNEEYKQKGCIE